MSELDGRSRVDGAQPEGAAPVDGRLVADDPQQEKSDWAPDEDPTLEQLRAWRAELNNGTGSRASGAPVRDATTVVTYSSSAEASSAAPMSVTQAPGSEAPVTQTPVTQTPVTQTPMTQTPHRETPVDSSPVSPTPDPSAAGRDPAGPPRGRHSGRAPERAQPSGNWAIPGFAWSRQAEQIIEDPVRPIPQRPLPPRAHVGWDVTRTSSSPVRAPVLSPAELAKSEASTVAFPALDLLSVAGDENAELAIEVKGLRKVFKDHVAVDGVSFSVPKGRIVALLGPNGAGKTTTVSMLCTLLKPDGGSASVNGCDVESDAAGVRRSVMLTGQFAALDEGLTGRENLVMFARLLGLRKSAAKSRAAELLEEFGLEAAADRKVGQYSGGMRRRIDIACGLVTEPTVVFLDEPTTGLDPRSRQEVWALVEKLRSEGVTVLLTTQYLEEADVLSDRIVVIDHGKVIAEGTSDELKLATGAAYCEVTPAHPAYLPRLRGALRNLLGSTAGDLDTPDGALSVPAPDGPATLALVLKRTEEAGIPLADIALRRPSLDEVFLALTDPDAKSSATQTGEARS